MKRTGWRLGLYVFALVFLLAGATQAGEKVVCFGDSMVAGPSELTFPDYLEFFVEPGDGEVVNEGQGGETTGEGYWRAMWLVISLQYHDADVWIYWEGGNDIIDWVEANDPYMLYNPADPNYPLRDDLDDQLARTKSNIAMTINTIQLTGAEVVIGTYMELVPWLPCDPSPIGFMTPGMIKKANAYLEELNGIIREVAAEEGVVLHDVRNTLGFVSGHLINYHDCLHQNLVGEFWKGLAWWLAVMPYI